MCTMCPGCKSWIGRGLSARQAVEWNLNFRGCLEEMGERLQRHMLTCKELNAQNAEGKWDWGWIRETIGASISIPIIGRYKMGRASYHIS